MLVSDENAVDLPTFGLPTRPTLMVDLRLDCQQSTDFYNSVGAPGISVSDTGTNIVSTSAPAVRIERIVIDSAIVKSLFF